MDLAKRMQARLWILFWIHNVPIDSPKTDVSKMKVCSRLLNLFSIDFEFVLETKLEKPLCLGSFHFTCLTLQLDQLSLQQTQT